MIVIIRITRLIIIINNIGKSNYLECIRYCTKVWNSFSGNHHRTHFYFVSTHISEIGVSEINSCKYCLNPLINDRIFFIFIRGEYIILWCVTCLLRVIQLPQIYLSGKRITIMSNSFWPLLSILVIRMIRK